MVAEKSSSFNIHCINMMLMMEFIITSIDLGLKMTQECEDTGIFPIPAIISSMCKFNVLGQYAKMHIYLNLDQLI